MPHWCWKTAWCFFWGEKTHIEMRYKIVSGRPKIYLASTWIYTFTIMSVHGHLRKESQLELKRKGSEKLASWVTNVCINHVTLFFIYFILHWIKIIYWLCTGKQEISHPYTWEFKVVQSFLKEIWLFYTAFGRNCL